MDSSRYTTMSKESKWCYLGEVAPYLSPMVVCLEPLTLQMVPAFEIIEADD